MNLWNRSAKGLMTRVLAGMLALAVLVPSVPSFGAEGESTPRERIAKMIAKQSGGGVTAQVTGRQITIDARRSYYTRTFAPRVGYARPRISVRVGGMLVGLPPESDGEGAPEALGIPDFDYEILKPEEGKPTRVKMTFGTAAMESWSITVPAAVVTPMTAVAIDERPVLYTLTGKGGDTLAHPGIDNHRLVFRLAVIDLFADNRSSLALRAETARMQAELVLYSALINLYNDPENDKAKKAVEGAYEVRMLLLGQSLGQRLEKGSDKRIREVVVGVTNDKFVTAVEGALNPLANLFATKSAPDRLVDVIVKAGMDKTFGRIEAQKSAGLLSMVEERPWKLNPEHLKSPDVAKDPKTSILAIKYRIAYDGVEQLTEKQAAELFKELPISALVQQSVSERLTPADLQLLQEYNDAVIVHRVISSVFQKRVVNFPEEKWEKMIEELGDLYKEHLGVKTAELRKRAGLWQAGALLHLEDKEMFGPPQLPKALYLK